MDDHTYIYIIDGERFSTLEGFCEEVGKVPVRRAAIGIDGSVLRDEFHKSHQEIAAPDRLCSAEGGTCDTRPTLRATCFATSGLVPGEQ